LKSFADLGRALTLTNLCRLFALLMVAWQPFPGEYRVPLVGSALLGLALTWRGEWRAVAEPAKRLALLLLCLLIPGLLSIPTSLAPSKSWGEIASVVLVGLAGLSVLYGLRRQQDHRWLQSGLVIVIAAWIGDGLLQALTGADVFGITPKAEGMINGPFTTNGIFGIIVSALTPLVLWEPLKQRQRWAIALLSGIIVTVILSGQRNNLLLLALGLIALSSLWSRRNRLIGAAALVAIVIAVYPFAPTLQQRSSWMISSGSEVAASMQGLRNNPGDAKSSKRLFDSLNKFTSDRGFLVDAGLKMIRDRPLTGVGINAFRPAYPLYAQLTPHDHRDTPTHAHNIYLELTAETGLIGLSGLLLAIGLCWRWFALACQERQRMAAPYAATLLIMLFPLTTHTVLFAAFYFTLIIMILGGFLAALFSPEAVIATHIELTPSEISSTS
jgi:O-antigen ligase